MKMDERGECLTLCAIIMEARSLCTSSKHQCVFRRGTRYSKTSRDIHDFSFLPSREITVRLKSAVCTTSKASSWIFLLQIRCVRQYQLPTELRVAPHPTLWPGVCVEHRCRTVLHMLHTAYPVVLSRLLGEDTVITCSHLLESAGICRRLFFLKQIESMVRLWFCGLAMLSWFLKKERSHKYW